MATAQLAWMAMQGPRQPRFPFQSEARIEHAQRCRLAATIQYAYRHVPHYRETMNCIGLSPAEISTASDLARLPLIERAALQRDPERYVSRQHPIEHYIPLQTGGSSGAPATIYHDPVSLFRAGAYHQRCGQLHRRIARRSIGCRSLLIGHASVPSKTSIDAMLAGLGYLVGARRRVASILDPIERNIHEINQFRPHILASFGSYLEALFVHLQASGEPFHRPRVVVYGGDGMSRSARALITETFGIPVFSSYGAYEAFGLGFECTEHLGYHINTDLYPVRVIDSDGCEVPHGERGEVVISNLINRGTVLLNYRVGDLAARLPGPCPCGRTLPLLTFVQGRVADWLTTSQGERVHPQTVAVVLDIEPEVLRYQVIQSAPTRFIVKLVVRPGSERDALTTRVQDEFAKYMGAIAQTSVEFVEDIPRTARGKVRAVIGLEGVQD